MRVLLLLLTVFSAHAQSFQYRLEGSFTSLATPDPANPAIVNYSINWNETSTDIQGVYQDNYFTQGSPRTLTGTVNANSRTMNVILPQTINDIRQLNFITSSTGAASGSAPMTITTRNNIGSVIDNASTFALLSALPNSTTGTNTNNNNCTVGFGALTGACGLYNGTFSESRDTNDRCNLLITGNPRLELGLNTAFSFLLNYIPQAANQDSHTIGSFRPSPLNGSVNVSSRTCGDLSGTTFPTGNCKTLNLSGFFSEDATNTFHFSGVYTITDEVTAESCAYSMTLNQESRY